MDEGMFAGAGERDVGPFEGGVLGDDQVRGVAGLSLGRERVLHVRQPHVRGVHLGAVVPPWDERFRNETQTDHAYRCLRKAQDNLMAGVTSLRGMSDRFNADIHLKAAVERLDF